MAGAARTWMRKYGPFAFSPMQRSQSASVTLSGVMDGSQPALAMRASMRPNLCIVVSTSPSMSAKLLALDLTVNARSGLSCCASFSAAPASDEYVITTAQPCWCKWAAMPAPMPLEPPLRSA